MSLTRRSIHFLKQDLEDLEKYYPPPLTVSLVVRKLVADHIQRLREDTARRLQQESTNVNI